MKPKIEVDSGYISAFKCKCGIWIDFPPIDKVFECPNCLRKWKLESNFLEDKIEIIEVEE